jgi:hypothetical protein
MKIFNVYRLTWETVNPKMALVIFEKELEVKDSTITDDQWQEITNYPVEYDINRIKFSYKRFSSVILTGYAVNSF